MNVEKIESLNLNTIFQECRKCGTCCKSFRKILLKPNEVERMKKLGANVGIMVSLNDLRKNNINELIEKEKEKQQAFMIHPDENGCIFLQKKNDKYSCKIYHYRPEVCHSFKCNMADNSMKDLFLRDSIYLLGMDRFGRNIQL